MGQHVLPSVGVQPAAELRHVQGPVHELHVLPSVGVQPAAQLRHVQRHDHVLHVLQRKFPVRRQQAAHPLRVDGHLGLRLRWLWLELVSGDLRLRSDRLECCSSDFENPKCCTYYGEKRESGAALLPPTSLIAANKRDYLPDPCFLYTGGSTSPSRKPSQLWGHRVRPGYPIPFAVAAHMQLARYRSVFGRVLRGETPTEAQYIQSGQRPAQRSTRLLKSCLGPTRGVVEGGHWTWVIGTVCVCLVGCRYTRDACCPGVGVLSWPEIALVGEK